MKAVFSVISPLQLILMDIQTFQNSHLIQFQLGASQLGAE